MLHRRDKDLPVMRVFAFDHRSQFEAMEGFTPAKADAFKTLCLHVAQKVSAGRDGYGILCDAELGSQTLDAATSSGLWIGRPVEHPGSRPLQWTPYLQDDLSGLAAWPANHVVKCLCFYHDADDAAMQDAQISTVKRLFDAARANGLEFLLEVIPSKVAPVTDDTTPAVITRFYDAGVYPDWWKLEPFSTRDAWTKAAKAITDRDPHTRGIVVLGLDAPQEALQDSFAMAAQEPLVKGFAVGRTIFADAARAWLRGDIDDAAAVTQMTSRYRALCDTWDKIKGL